ncbi:MAG: acyl-CoA dehydrogenase [Ornithinibacter sp.]
MHENTPWGFSTWGDPRLTAQARTATGDLDQALCVARSLESLAEGLGTDSTPLIRALATLGSVDLSTARAAEPHLDATAILAQARRAGHAVPEITGPYTWGVYAASAPGASLRATGPRGREGEWSLSGSKAWCSLGGRVSHALVTAADESGAQRLFAVGLRSGGVSFDGGSWQPRGLREISTGTLTFHGHSARAIGGPGWYLERPGFFWGAIGVAAIWFGAAAALAGTLWRAASARTPDQIALTHLGRCDVLLHGAQLVLADAARHIDDPGSAPEAAAVLAARVRAHVAAVAEEVLTVVGHALGPAPLALDGEHAARVADLTLYLRQHHAERDLARLGQMVSRAEVGGGREPR